MAIPIVLDHQIASMREKFAHADWLTSTQDGLTRSTHQIFGMQAGMTDKPTVVRSFTACADGRTVPYLVWYRHE